MCVSNCVYKSILISFYPRCRRKIIASHFDESWESTQCNAMCDNCNNPKTVKSICINKYCMDVYKILSSAMEADTKLTGLSFKYNPLGLPIIYNNVNFNNFFILAQMLLDVWYGKGNKKVLKSDVKPPIFLRTQAEMILGVLLVEGYLTEDFHYTPYATISYIKKGSNFMKMFNFYLKCI